LQEQLGLWYRPGDIDPKYYNPLANPGMRQMRELVNFLPLQLVTLLGATVLVTGRFPFPFLTVLIIILLWYMVYDWNATLSVPYGPENDWEAWMSAVYGAACVGVAYTMEKIHHKRQRQNDDGSDARDWAFWIYLVGGWAFWIDIMMPSVWYDTEVDHFGNFALNVALIGLAVVLKRNIFMLTGILGVSVYLLHLDDLFGEYVLFPFVLTLVGSAIVAWGLYRNRAMNDEMLTRLLVDSENRQQDEQGDIRLEDQHPQQHSQPPRSSLHEVDMAVEDGGIDPV
jgi:hypothetical protein